MSDRVEWTIHAPSLEAFKRGLAAGDSQPEWFRLRREAEELALRPARRRRSGGGGSEGEISRSSSEVKA